MPQGAFLKFSPFFLSPFPVSRALEAGAQDYWPTPVDLEAVAREIAGMLEAKRSATHGATAGQPRESGLPGGGRGRKDVVGRTGVFPVSAAASASPAATIHDEMSLGQETRGSAGYEHHGDSEITNLDLLQEKLARPAEQKPKGKAAHKK